LLMYSSTVDSIFIQVLEVMGKLDPGYSPWRGQMMRELSKAKIAKAVREKDLGKLAKAKADEKFLAMYIAYHQAILYKNENKNG